MKSRNRRTKAVQKKRTSPGPGSAGRRGTVGRKGRGPSPKNRG